MKTWNSHRRRLERGMVAGVLSAVVLTASMSIQVLAADSNTVFTSGEPQGAAIAVTANAGAAQNVSKSFLTYTDTAKQEKAEAEKQAEEARKAEEERQRKLAQEADTSLLAALIYCEAGNQPYQGQVAVGAVVMNRLHAGYASTLRGVIYQSGQFGPAMTGKLDRVLASGNIPSSCRQAAVDALSGVSPVGNALHFGDGINTGIKIGAHWFH